MCSDYHLESIHVWIGNTLLIGITNCVESYPLVSYGSGWEHPPVLNRTIFSSPFAQFMSVITIFLKNTKDMTQLSMCFLFNLFSGHCKELG